MEPHVDQSNRDHPDLEALHSRVEGGILEPSIAAHIESCQLCTASLAALEKAEKCLESLALPSISAPTAKCPNESTWSEVAAGILRESEVAAALDHAVHCGHCANLLNEARQDLNSEPPDEIRRLIAELHSNTESGRREMAARLAHSSARGKVWHLPRYRWLLPLAGFGLAVLGVMIYWRASNSPERLLAVAYSQRRVSDLRIPGAQYGPIRTQRGGILPQSPPALLEAQAKILRELQRAPDSPDWLEVSARADLLNYDYPSALRDAQAALRQRPAWVPALIDESAAYFERADAEQEATDYGLCLERLSQALARGADSTARFNRAISYERLHLYHEALTDWTTYLQSDSKSAWAVEARQHMRVIEGKLRGSGLTLPRAAGEMHDGERIAADRIEAYLDDATRKLPALAHIPSTDQLKRLAGMLRSENGDYWLSDVLRQLPQSSSSFASFSQAAVSLVGAIDADAGRDLEQGLLQSRRSLDLFRKAGTPAAEFRAAIELVYALHRSGDFQNCLQLSSTLVPTAKTNRYTWAEAQLKIELASCENGLGLKGPALQTIREASRIAHGAGYPVLSLRALGIEAAMANAGHDRRRSWNLCVEGLRIFWSGTFPAVRAQQFYDTLAATSSDSMEPQLAAVFAREAAIAADASGNPTLRATAHFWAGKRSAAAGRTDAAVELISAAKLLDALPPTAEMQGYRAETGIGLADIAVTDGRLSEAEHLLLNARRELPTNSRFQLAARYFHVLSKLDRARKLTVEEENSLRCEIALAHIALGSLSRDYDRLVWVRDLSGAYGRLAQFELTQHNSPERAFELIEAFRDASWQDASPSSRLDVEALESHPPQPALPLLSDIQSAAGDVTLLSYFLLPEGMAGWALSPTGLSFAITQVSAERMSSLVSDFRDAVSSPASDAQHLRQLSAELYRILIAPLRNRISPTTPILFAEPPGLEGIPLQALIEPHGVYFGATHAISVWPGVACLMKLRPSVPIAVTAPALVVAPSAPSGTARPTVGLPDASSEASEVAGLFRAPTLLAGRTAQRSEIEREMPNAVVFHFAGHSTADGGRVTLLLAPEAVNSDQGEALNLNALNTSLLERCALAVLSACSTAGLGGAGPADPDSLVRGLLHAGTPRVVAARWNVDSQATAKFMGLFYRDMLAGGTAAESLKQASAKIAADPDTAHPYFWAAFQLYGRF